ncbi:MAG: HAD family phosphatase [bacterium]|nr:HAD family phosphatase [bacterium]
MNIKNYLFDFDGTLFDTQKLHAAVESELFAENGIAMPPEEITEKYAGIKTEAFFAELLGDEKLAKTLIAKKWEKLIPLARTAEPLGDLHTLFSSLKAKGLLFGIGTASPLSWVEEILAINNLTPYFSEKSIITGEMVEQGKPHPETWQRLQCGVPGENCLVVEDGVAGVFAAKAANMNYVVVGKPNDKFPEDSVFIQSVSSLIN